MANAKSNGCCSGGPRLIFACSGAADVGEIADKAARKMTKEGAGKMFCMAGIGGRISGIMKTIESAEKILAIDGCMLNCVKNTLELAGFKKCSYINLGELGFEKFNTEVTEENITRVTDKVKEMMM